MYWPAFLMAADLPLPKRLIVHGHWTIGGAKMSKSQGNTVDPFKMRETYGVDAFRYFLMREARLDSDADFSLAEFAKTVNRDLANQLGNLITRAFNQKFLAVIPQSSLIVEPSPQVLGQTLEVCEQAATNFDSSQYHVGLERLSTLIHDANRQFNREEPWTRITSPDQHDTVRQLLCDVSCKITAYAMMLQPFIPGSAEGILDRFKVHRSQRYYPNLGQVVKSIALHRDSFEAASTSPPFRRVIL